MINLLLYSFVYNVETVESADDCSVEPKQEIGIIATIGFYRPALKRRHTCRHHT